ncbi:hypothetical protein ACFC09_07485 [Streptomyces sp. NPDC056161]|uniref:hypothetical protein n=1 Tax=Streptomyces sp. NPDC056161 TaxID=3345732 RepID=UPI0035D552C8
MKRPEPTHEPARLRRVRIPGTVIAPPRRSRPRPRPRPENVTGANAAAPATDVPRTTDE